MKQRMSYITLGVVCLAWVCSACSTQKNTASSRWYHATNTRYNIHYNAQLAYEEALLSKNEAHKDDFTRLLNVFPFDESTLEKTSEGGSFNKVIDKCVKAIKLHSITKKPIKDADKRGNEQYQQWYKQREFNPFLKHSWLLMAKAEYQNNDYLKAISTFTYIARHFANDAEVVAQSRVWLIKAYGEMGWYFEAEDLLKKIELAGGVPHHLQGEFAAACANLTLRQGKLQESVPHLQTAVKTADNARNAARWKYLLGQVYQQLGQKAMAQQTFAHIGGLSVPFELLLNARLKQAENEESGKLLHTVKMLDDMARAERYKPHLDQIFFTQGNIFLQNGDTAKAVAAYRKAVGKSEQAGIAKTRAQVALGDLLFVRRKYTDAQPHYADALSALSKRDDAYERVMHRSKVLDELVVYHQAVRTQDSLQHLVQLPEKARLAIIDSVIASVKAREKEEALAQAREKAQENADVANTISDFEVPITPITQPGQSNFYFDNPQVVAQGKKQFRRRWGNRKQEDDWRRKNKALTVLFAASPEENDTVADSVQSPVPEIQATNDVHSLDYYLAQLPFTAEALEESNQTIDDALFQMGGIYRNLLESPEMAIEAYETELNRFPETPNKEEVLYRLFMLYSEVGNKSAAEKFRLRVIAEYPQSERAKLFAQPNFEWIMRNGTTLQNELYDRAYNAYRKSDTQGVAQAYSEIKQKYPQSELMPKFALLDALSHAQRRDTQRFRNGLEGILKQHPQSEAATLASEMLKQLHAGKQPAEGNSPIATSIWQTAFYSADSATAIRDSIPAFTLTENAPHLLALMYPLSSARKNELLYTLADYNFSHYVVSTFPLEFDDRPQVGILLIKGFQNFNLLAQYVNDALAKSLFNNLGNGVMPVPISAENYDILRNGGSLNSYLNFYTEHYGTRTPRLSDVWKRISQSENTPSADDSEPTQIQIDSIPVSEDIKTPPSTGKRDIDIYTIKAPSALPATKELPKKDEKASAESEKPKRSVRKDVAGKKEADDAKAQEKAKQEEQKQAEKLKREAEKQAEKEKRELEKAREKAKEEARKAKEQELKRKAKEREERLKAREQEREERLKAREKLRKGKSA